MTDDLKKQLETLTPKRKPVFGEYVVDPLVEAIACDKKIRVAFRVSEIAYIAEYSDSETWIVLKTDTVRIVAILPFAELRDKIFSGAGEDVDLTAVTASGARAVKAKPAAAEFNAKAGKKIENKPLTITAFVHEEDGENFLMYSFKEKDILWDEIEGIDSDFGGFATKIVLDHYDSPFGDDTLILELPRARFMSLYNEAKMQQHGDLDIRAETVSREKPVKDDKMEIMAFVRPVRNPNHMHFCFLETDIDWRGIREIDHYSQKGKRCLNMAPLPDKQGPFGKDFFVIDMSREKFMALYSEAKRKGKTQLDLSDVTKPKPKKKWGFF